MDARPYCPADHAACIALLQTRGCGGQQAAFESHLDPDRFFVLEHEGAILGCGGVDVAGGVTRLVWGMIDPRWERRGLGRFLLLYRSRLAKTEFLEVETPDEFAAFYEKAGFRRAGAKLVKRLAVCA